MNDNKTLNQKIIETRKQITSLQQEAESKAPTIAHLKYLAALLHTSNDNAIIIFIVMIMMVFDTLAMYLMITSDWIKTITGQSPQPKRVVVKPLPPVKREEEIVLEPITEQVSDQVSEQPTENKVKSFVNNFIFKKDKNNIEKKVSHLVKLLREDESIIDKKSFIKSLSMTPLIVQKLEEELGPDSEIMIKIRSKLKM